MNKFFALAVLACMSLAPVCAQTDAAATSITLQSAISDALAHNKQLQASAQDRELYYQKVREARAGGLPQASASLTGTTYFNKEMEFGGMAKISMPNSLTLAATVSWTLSLQQIQGVKLAKIAQNITDQTIASSELDVKANVTDTYYAVLVYKRTLEILAENVKAMEDIARHTQNSYEVGYVEKTDVDQINVTVATLKNAVISTERSLETTKRLLVLQMGIDINTKIEPQENLLDIIGESNTATVDSSNFNIENNVTYKTLALSREVNEATVKLRKFAYLPTLTAAYQYSNAIKGGFMNFDHVGSLTLSIPIFSGFARHSQVKQAQVEVARTDINMALLQESLQQNDEQYRFELNSAIDAYNLQKENLSVAKRVLDNYRNKYEQGALSSLNLTQANANYLQAETSYATACLDVLMAHTKLCKLYNSFPY